ncbi:benzoate-CoA ligase family protein [Rhodosalinus sp. FB01]|uniref:benzoate-CoA ligase family protein n=1 Tax=Rhodosalinus sp. FB01 TaxID=3239194 RepID=UPI00352632E5
MRIGRIEVLGGGPAGLYTAILARRRLGDVAVRVTERNPRGATFGFGVVFSDRALEFLRADDPDTHDLVTPRMETWRDMTLDQPEGRVVLDGVGFSAIGRLELIELLTQRAEAEGVALRFGHELGAVDELDADLVVGADGLNSLVRQSDPQGFGETLSHLENRFAWFGAPRAFDTLTQSFLRTEKGALNAHHYRYAPEMSTFIVEATPESFAAHGFGEMTEAESAAACAEIFAEVLEGAPLLTNRSHWRRFPRLWCRRWARGNRVILGDAAHTAHFSIGSGTRLAMEDAIALVAALEAGATLDAALDDWQATRMPVAKKIVDAANTSADWYEAFDRHMALGPLDFARSYITRSGRVDDEKLRRLAPRFMARYEAEKAGRLFDPVPDDAPGAAEIGFDKAAHPNCATILWDNLPANAEKLAVTGPAGSLTYAELAAEAARWGNAFTAAGLAPGDRIPMLLDDRPDYVAAFFGAVRAGFVPVLLNTQTTQDLLSYFLQDTGARIAVCEAALAGMAEAARAGSALERLVVVGRDGPEGADAFLAGQPDTLAPAGTGPDDMAFWMYSSGSTGRPKGIVHLHHDMAYTAQSYGRHILGLAPGDVCFSVPKMFFAYGFGNAVTFPFAAGATSVLMPGRPEPQAVLDTIEGHRPTVLFGLPTLYTALARAEGVEARDLSSLRLSISAAETLSAEVYDRWRALAGHGPTEGLGSTEMLHIYLSNRHDDHRLGSAGARVPGYEVRLVTPGGREAAPGEEGVMEVRGHSSAPLYWKRPDKTRETMRGDWIHTGDRFVERDGHFYFQGRADDLVKVSGQWVWPLEVERCLAEHPEVHECAVLAERLPDGRTTLRAVVAPVAGARPDIAALQDFVKARLQPYKYPRLVEFAAALPKTGTGKIDRQALRTQARKGAA